MKNPENQGEIMACLNKYCCSRCSDCDRPRLPQSSMSGQWWWWWWWWGGGGGVTLPVVTERDSHNLNPSTEKQHLFPLLIIFITLFYLQ